MRLKERNAIDLTNIKIDKSLKFKNNQVLKLRCFKCNKIYFTTFSNFKKNFICKCALCEYPNQLESVKNKIKQTNLEKYGVENWFSSKQMQTLKRTEYLFDNQNFDSSVELVFYIYCKDLNLNIKRNPTQFCYKTPDNKEHFYYPDFEVNNQLIEIKGTQFLKEDGSWKNPNDSSLDSYLEAKHQCAI